MAVNNDTVRITAGLLNSQLSDPPIGSTSTDFTTGFTDGDVAKDEYVILSTSPTALTGAGLSTRGGFLKVTNPSAIDVVLKSGTTTIGTLPAKTASGQASCCVLPVDAGIVINAVAASGTPTIGITLVQVTVNA